MNQLIITLGRGHRADGNRYRTATYEFPDGTQSAPTPFFGLALLKWLQATRSRKRERVDRLIILGTTGSMWDALLEVPEIESALADAMQLYEKLAALAAQINIASTDLADLEKACAEALGLPTVCALIPFGFNHAEQAQILDTLGQLTEPDSRVYLDVTHGFRHLPMLQMLSAFHLVETHHCSIGGIYYGALEMTPRNTENPVTPVVELGFAGEMIKWIRAVTVVNQTGNYRILSNLPGMESLETDLKREHFLEQVSRTAIARKTAAGIRNVLSEPLPTPAGELFRKRLREEFNWTSQGSHALRQLACAYKAFGHKNYLQAITLLHEALVTSLIDYEKGEDPENFGHRKDAGERLNRSDDDRIVANLRNAMAHGTRPQGGGINNRVRKALADEANFRETFCGLMKYAEATIRERMQSQ